MKNVHKTMSLQSCNMLMSKTEQMEPIYLKKKYGCFNPGNAPTEYYDIGLDLTGVSRKHISSEIDIVANELNDEEFRGMVRSLNRKQKEFFFSHPSLEQDFKCTGI